MERLGSRQASTSSDPSLKRCLGDLARLVGKRRLLMRDVALIPYESDALTAFRQRPAAVVLLESRDEVIEALAPRSNGLYVDVTLGAGGNACGYADYRGRKRVCA